MINKFRLGLLCASVLALASAGMANTLTLCPDTASQYGTAGSSFSSSTETGVCLTSVTMTIGNAQDYARLAWDSTSAGYPAGLTLGSFQGGNADVSVSGNDQPFYMLAFVDSTDSLGQTNATDQILMIEFQSSTVAGSTMALDPNATLFNLFDNSTGQYLQGGQHTTNTLDGWLAADPFLASESLDSIRLGMGLAGGSAPGGSVTVNSFVGTYTSPVPEPASVSLIGGVVIGLAALLRRRARS